MQMSACCSGLCSVTCNATMPRPPPINDIMQQLKNRHIQLAGLGRMARRCSHGLQECTATWAMALPGSSALVHAKMPRGAPPGTCRPNAQTWEFVSGLVLRSKLLAATHALACLVQICMSQEGAHPGPGRHPGCRTGRQMGCRLTGSRRCTLPPCAPPQAAQQW
jgi:hypothetical protein